MVAHAQGFQAHLASLVIEGAFERRPNLRFVMIEGGFGWLPSLCWRLDKLWRRLADETPHLKRLPSEYIRDHVWLTTQPMEEPPNREHLLDLVEWVGWDRLLFASDYPHWDFDDPTQTLPAIDGRGGSRCSTTTRSRCTAPECCRRCSSATARPCWRCVRRGHAISSPD